MTTGDPLARWQEAAAWVQRTLAEVNRIWATAPGFDRDEAVRRRLDKDHDQTEGTP